MTNRKQISLYFSSCLSFKRKIYILCSTDEQCRDKARVYRCVPRIILSIYTNGVLCKLGSHMRLLWRNYDCSTADNISPRRIKLLFQGSISTRWPVWAIIRAGSAATDAQAGYATSRWPRSICRFKAKAIRENMKKEISLPHLEHFFGTRISVTFTLNG